MLISFFFNGSLKFSSKFMFLFLDIGMDQNHFSVILSLKVSPIQKLLLHFLLERLLHDFVMLNK